MGRERELATLAACLHRARRGGAEVALVDGASGSGKTTLLRRFLSLESGVTLLHASGDRRERSLRFGVVAQLTPDPDHPPLPDAGRSPPDTAGVGAELLTRWRELQARRPLVVVVEDAQWADLPSLRSLAFAIRRLRAERVLVLISSTEAGHARLPESLRRAHLTRAASTIHLDGLTVDEIRQLVSQLTGRRTSASSAARLRDHTLGNPQRIAAVVAELPAGWGASPPALPLPAPRAYRARVARRLSAYPAAARELVVAAAILGVRCRLRDAARLAGIADPVAALEAAADVLEVTPAGPDLAFRDPLVRAAVYQDLTVARRTCLHRRAAALTGDEAVSLHHRSTATLGEDRELTGDLLSHARAEASHGRLANAARATLAAARAADPGQHDAIVLAGVELLLRAGRSADAGDLRETIEATSGGAAREYVLGVMSLHEGRWHDAQERLDRAWVGCLSGASELRPRLAATRIQLACLHAHDPEAAGEGHLADVEVPRGDSRASADLAPSFELPTAELQLVDDRVLRGVHKLWSTNLVGARGELQEAARLATRAEGDVTRSFALGQLAWVEYLAGEWDAAIDAAEQAVASAEDQSWLLPYLHTIAIAPLLGRGRTEQAAVHVTAAVRIAQQTTTPGAATGAAIASAMLHLARDEHRAAVAALAPLCREHDPLGQPWTATSWLPVGIEALIRDGRLHEASAMLTDLEMATRSAGSPSAALELGRLHGLLLAAGGDTTTAEATYRRTLATGAPPTPFLRARLELELGAQLRRSGRAAEAEPFLQRAHASFTALGAAPDLRRCQRELVACGSRVARRLALRGARLTPQELAVATLVGRGRSNREVAEELVVSVKTVEYHLGNVYAKLDVASRTQLCARLLGGSDATTPALALARGEDGSATPLTGQPSGCQQLDC